MTADFWAGSHFNRWVVDRSSLRQARVEDTHYAGNSEYLDFFAIYFGNVIAKLGRKLQVRQRVMATASVYFRRFYLKNSYSETDPFMVIAACCYVAAKAEESPVHIKNVVSEARNVFKLYGIKNFPTDTSRIAEMEFYLVDDLECDLYVFHPYRTLLALCKNTVDAGSSPDIIEAGELGAGLTEHDGPRFWGTGVGKLELSEGALQTAWFIINDTYRSDICVLYAPHHIAIAAIYLTLILHEQTRQSLIVPALSAASNLDQVSESRKMQQDPIDFLAGLNVSMPLVSTIVQEIISLYNVWDRYKEDLGPENNNKPTSRKTHKAFIGNDGNVKEVTAGYLSDLLKKMREKRTGEGSAARPVAVNKMLERTQAAG